jgi:D-serine deaminase-like pyridoxal phosphate-dependent protein
VQTPLQGPAATSLGVGDRVWFRHAKSGEPAERIERYHLVSGEQVIDELPTYRGEGKAFL